MKILKRILTFLAILVIVILLAGFIFFRNLTHRALPDYNADLQLKGLHAPVEVYRDSFAVPHVYAQDEHDLYMAVGYLMAEDRLWQMDMLRRVTEGRLSEIFGADYVETDLLLRSLRFSKKSNNILLHTDSSSLVAIHSFSDGVNQYILTHAHHLPPEFTILRYKPELWQPYQSLNMIGYMAWDLKAGWSEILLSTLQQAVDSVRYQQLLPDMFRTQPTVYPLDQPGSFTSLLPSLLLHSDKLQSMGADVLEASNNWAVSGSKTTTGKPLLANDMHLGLSIPGIWYQMHQVIPGKLNVTGLVLPGAPVIICGHNDSIAWGMTNTYVDNLDFYEEKVNPDDTDMYLYNNEWKRFEVLKTVIRTSKGDSIEKTLRFSHRGPVVSDFKKMPGNLVTMHWVGDEISDEFHSVMLLNRASNWAKFTDALKTFTSISQNIVYADVKGNIGLFCAAGIPIRKRDIAMGILPGSTDEYDWKGYVPFNELPRTYNPVAGYVASANNRTIPADYPYHVGTWYALPSRYERITALLSSDTLLSVEDFKHIQLDQQSRLAEKYLPIILHELENYKTDSPQTAKALQLLKAWDYKMNSESAAAAIFETLYLQFIHCVFADELGEGLFDNFNGTTSISRTATDQLMESRNSPWFDDTNTGNKTEQFHDMVICAFDKAVAELEGRLGNNPDAWEWGSIHHLVLTHPLASVKILDKVFHLNRGPFPVGGSFHTISPYSYDSNKPFDSSHGSSHRHIFDLADWDRSLTIIPTGNSGIPASKHYCDQTLMYVKGQYHPDYFTKKKIAGSARYHMKFVP